jgi:peptidoglycan L-alanyl-D-glutamate endopeptidase CwlK
MQALSPNKPTIVAQKAKRWVPMLTPAQVPSLAAYSEALRRWMDDPVLRLAKQPIITEYYRSPERQDEVV